MPRKKLLIVDDEPNIGELLTEAFDSQYDVMTATTGEEAIRKAVLEHPSCILMDIMMPQMGGFILCEILKSMRQTQLIPIIMLSAKPRHEALKLAKEMGALDFIEKPFSIQTLAAAISHALETAPEERRRTPRVKMKIPVIIRGKDIHQNEFEVNSDTEDVSRFGALVTLPIQVPVGQQVELRQAIFTSTERDAPHMLARIVWNDGEGIIGPYRHGLEFIYPTSNWVVSQ